MDTTSPDQLVRHLIAGDSRAVAALAARSTTSEDPTVLVAAALVVPGWRPLLERAAVSAGDAAQRQVIAIAAAHLRGETDRALVLARDHLADHPDSLLVAHIAAASAQR
jgi:hypothetical protein